MNAAPQDYRLPDLDDTPGREPYCTAHGCGLPVDPRRGPSGRLVHDATFGVLVPGHPVEVAWRDREQVQVTP